ncbi:MAG TPA: S-layer homology domain-containing protein [Bacillota bacterium]|nr:S-layer homology domain-containing protein [Bacillota bacterium]
MRNLRKLLVVTMIVTMVAGFAGMAAAATVAARPFTDAVGHEFEKELTAMRALGIMLGDAGTTLVRPDAPITRAEMAVIITRALGRDRLAGALGAFQPAFADAVPTWAWGAVNVVSNMGIVRGFPDGTFGATRNVTHAEALAMLIRATGHEPGIMGVWPLNFMMSGFDLGISGRVEAFANLPSSRGEIAHFVFNTLTIRQGGMVTGVFSATARDPLVVPITGLGADFLPATRDLTIAGVSRRVAPTVHLWGFAGFPEMRGAQLRALRNPAGEIVFIEPNLAVTVRTGTFDRVDATVTPNRIILTDATNLPLGALVYYRRNEGIPVTGAAAMPAGAVVVGDSVSLTIEGGAVVLVEATRLNITGPTVPAGAVLPGAVIAATTVPGVAGVPAAATPRITLVDPAVYYDVPAATRITLNGAAATLADLRRDDVVYIATRGGIHAEATPTIIIEAHRTLLTGAVVSQRHVWTTGLPTPTGHSFITLRLADGTTRELRWFNDALTTPLAAVTPGSTITYALNRDGRARLEIAAVLATNIVRVGTVADLPGVTPARTSVTFDMRGTAVTHVTYGGFPAAQIGNIGRITVSAATGEVTEYVPLWAVVYDDPPTEPYRAQVFSVDAAANVVTLQVYREATGLGHEYLVTHPDFVAYDQSAVAASRAIGPFRPTANLTVGTRVYFRTLAGDGRVLAIFRKRAQDRWTD